MITKSDLIDHLAVERNGVVITKSSAAATVDEIFRWLTNGIRDHGEVRIAGFGTFGITERDATTGRNPRTGAKIEIAARKTIKFKAAKALSGAVNE